MVVQNGGRAPVLMMGESVLWPIGHELFPGASTPLMVVAILLMWAGSKCMQKIPPSQHVPSQSVELKDA